MHQQSPASVQVAMSHLSPGCISLSLGALYRQWHDVLHYKNTSAAAAVICTGCLDGDGNADVVFQSSKCVLC